MSNEFLTACTIAFGMVAAMGFSMGLYAVIIVKAMEKSTHQVTYMPIKNDGKLEQDLNADFNLGE